MKEHLNYWTTEQQTEAALIYYETFNTGLS